jgi:CHASE3 domain sensor protein
VDSVAVRLLVPGVALAVLLLAVFFAQREATAALSRNVRAQARAEQEVSLAYRSETLLLDLETGVRGFLLTHGLSAVIEESRGAPPAAATGSTRPSTGC